MHNRFDTLVDGVSRLWGALRATAIASAMLGAMGWAQPVEDTLSTAPDSVQMPVNPGTPKIKAARLPYVGVFAATTFFNLDEKNRLARMLQQPGGSTLQPFESVHMAFPLGMMAAYPILTHLDVSVKLEGIWYSQSALFQAPGLEGVPGPVSEERYVVQALLGGMGAKYLIPAAFLSVTGQPGLYVGYWHLWDLGLAELYTNHGSVRAEFEPGGTGYEFQVGFQHSPSKSFFWNAAISYQNLGFSSEANWEELARNSESATPSNGKASWNLAGLKIALNLYYQFGARKSGSIPTTVPARFDTPMQSALLFSHE